VDTAKIDRVIAEIIARQEQGETIDLGDWIAKHEDIADSLRSFFANVDLFQNNLASGSIDRQFDGRRLDGRQRDCLDTGGQNSHTLPAHSGGLPEEFSSGKIEFGRYRIKRLLGEGGMGEVYLARDAVLDRAVAIKVPKFSSHDRANQIERFRREAMSTANLRHRNICPVYDVGSYQGVNYLTMAYIKGKPLSKLVNTKNRILQRKAAFIVVKLADALFAAHESGFIHRDIKPSNVLIDSSGEPILMDFGLARRIEVGEDSGITQTGCIAGTPAYMSPEQIRGSREEVGPPSDIYSLGLILYELLTGRIPFQGSALEVISKTLLGDPPSIRDLRPNVDHELEQICMRMMAKSTEDRYESMSEVAVELKAVARRLKASESQKPPVCGEVESSSHVDTHDSINTAITRSTPAPSPDIGGNHFADTTAEQRPVLRYLDEISTPQRVALVCVSLLSLCLMGFTGQQWNKQARDLPAKQDDVPNTIPVDPPPNNPPPPSNPGPEEEPASIGPETHGTPDDSIESGESPKQRRDGIGSITIHNVQTAGEPITVGETVTVEIEVTVDKAFASQFAHQNERTDSIPARGIGKVWLERKGADGEIEALQHRPPIDYLYELDSWESALGDAIKPQETVTVLYQMDTHGFEPGRYRVYIEYVDANEKTLAANSTSFRLKAEDGQANPESELTEVPEKPDRPEQNPRRKPAPVGEMIREKVNRVLQPPPDAKDDKDAPGEDDHAARKAFNQNLPWWFAPPETRAITYVAGIQDFSDKLDHVARTLRQTPPDLLNSFIAGIMIKRGLDRNGSLVCLYGPASGPNNVSPFAFMLPRLEPGPAGNVNDAETVHLRVHKFKHINAGNYICFSKPNDYGWFQRCSNRPSGFAEQLGGLNRFLLQQDVGFALSKSAVTKGVKIQLPLSESFPIPIELDEIAKYAFDFSGLKVAAGGIKILEADGVRVSVAAATDDARDTGQWHRSMQLDRDELFKTLPDGPVALALGISSCRQWNRSLEQIIKEELRDPEIGGERLAEMISLDSLKGCTVMLSAQPNLPPEKIAEQLHLQFKVDNAVDSIDAIYDCLKELEELLEEIGGHRISVEKKQLRGDDAIVGHVRLMSDEDKFSVHQFTLWPLDDDTLMMQGGEPEVLNQIVKRIRAGDRLVNNANIQSTLRLAEPNAQQVLLIDGYNTCEIIWQLQKASGQNPPFNAKTFFADIQNTQPLLISGQFESSLIEFRVTASQPLLTKVSAPLSLEIISWAGEKLAKGEPLEPDEQLIGILTKQRVPRDLNKQRVRRDAPNGVRNQSPIPLQIDADQVSNSAVWLQIKSKAYQFSNSAVWLKIMLKAVSPW
jgi:serine/threonine protein kinase